MGEELGLGCGWEPGVRVGIAVWGVGANPSSPNPSATPDPLRDAQSRLVMHTLMHYKSFERLLIARIGPSIARHIALEEVVASGGPTVASQIALVELLPSLTLTLTLTLTLPLTLTLTLTLTLSLTLSRSLTLTRTPTLTQVALLLAEANAYTSALGVLSRFELRMQEIHGRHGGDVGEM